MRGELGVGGQPGGQVGRALEVEQGSEQALQIVSRELRLAQNGVQQSRANRFPGMYGNHGGSAIGMTEKVMAAFHPQAFKSQLQQHIEQLLAAEGWQPAHASTQTR